MGNSSVKGVDQRQRRGLGRGAQRVAQPAPERGELRYEQRWEDVSMVRVLSEIEP